MNKTEYRLGAVLSDGRREVCMVRDWTGEECRPMPVGVTKDGTYYGEELKSL